MQPIRAIKAIRVSPAMQRGNVGADKFCTFTILVKETSPFYKWYRKAVSMGWYKIREKLEFPSR